MSYAPFGEGYAGGAPWVQFTSAGSAFTVYDTENQSGSLTDFTFRRYSPVQGRWISPDPAGLAAVDPSNPQSWNRYAYALNNPLSYTDPTGLWCVWEDGTHDDDPGNGGADSGGCADQGGHWDAFDTITGIFQDSSGNVTRINYIGGGACTTANCGARGTLEQFDQTLKSYSVLSTEPNWTGTFLSSFFGDFALDFGPGSCLDVALDSYKPVVNSFKKTQDYAKNYVAPIVASLPGAGASLANTIYSTVQYGADRGNALEMGGAISAGATFLASQGQVAVSGIASAAKNPAVVLGIADAALAYGIINEATAAYQGKCH
jgi:RHS repeat-associated protein